MANNLDAIGAARPSRVRRSRVIGSGSALSMSLVLLAEFRRASAAARRYDALRYGSARDDRMAGADIPRQVFEELYSK
jgi:hypothetical protein